MMKHLDTFCLVNCALCIVLFSGCGQKLPSDLPKLETVKLSFIQEGKPLTDATVQLLPKEDSKWAAVAVTDTRGVAEFFTQGNYKGVPQGEYVITVAKTFSEESKLRECPPGMSYPDWQAAVSNEKLPSYNLVEEKYADKSTSPLSVKIPIAEKDLPPFDTGKAVRIEIKHP